MEDFPPDLQRARELVLRHGWNATAYQIVNPGMRYWFSPAGDGVVGFVEAHGFRVVAGAPVCAEDRLPAVRRDFEEDAAAAGCRVCYFGAETRLESHLSHSPTHAKVLLGAQPSFAPAEWPRMLRGHASLRAQLQRARNKGVTVRECSADEASTRLDLRGCLYEWLATRGLPPLHFLVEPETLGRLHDRRVFVAERRGTVVAFLVASPIPRRNGWLIEQMIRGRQAPNGTTELMLHAAVCAFAESDSRYVTLGLSPLSRQVREEQRGNPWWLRGLLAWMRAHGRRFYNFEGLDAFKTKFRPSHWEPVFAICNQPRFTPRALYAIAGAFTRGKPIRTGLQALAHAFAQEVGWGNGR